MESLLTLFWYSERSKTIEMTSDGKAGEAIKVEIWN